MRLKRKRFCLFVVEKVLRVEEANLGWEKVMELWRWGALRTRLDL